MAIIRVAIDVPLENNFLYNIKDISSDDVGQRVAVPFGGRGEKITVGLILAIENDGWDNDLKEVVEVFRDAPAIPRSLLQVLDFVSNYYQEYANQVLLSALPSRLKKVVSSKLRTLPKNKSVSTNEKIALIAPELNQEQQLAIDKIQLDRYQTYLLYGITGSGKTEVYLQVMSKVLAAEKQVLLLVPEINLTPQLEANISNRLPQYSMVALHSDMTEAARLRAWLAAANNQARIIIGTRLSIFTPLPSLGLIIVDEEHDISYKQQDGVRYSARDVAIFRAHNENIPIILGSATPSLETWANAERGRFVRLQMLQRANPAAKLPEIRLINTKKVKLSEGLSDDLIKAIEIRLERQEQSLIFLNRRGYAPVISCLNCNWIAKCHQCSANLVVHLSERVLRCHHCGFSTRIPRACPTCANQNIETFGRGTQRVEEALIQLFPQARIIRVDRDAVVNRQQWLDILEKIYLGEVDIIIGTQMLAKGHDFPRLTLVGVLNSDAALLSADCRAPERLFAQLMQVGGRAGRAELSGEVLIQTNMPEHPLFTAICQHDYPLFAKNQLEMRRSLNFPPYSYHAMLRADALKLSESLEFLQLAANLPSVAEHQQIVIYDAVPMLLVRLANHERAQMLIESNSRTALQNFLSIFRGELREMRKKFSRHLRWHIEVDPQDY